MRYYRSLLAKDFVVRQNCFKFVANLFMVIMSQAFQLYDYINRGFLSESLYLYNIVIKKLLIELWVSHSIMN